MLNLPRCPGGYVFVSERHSCQNRAKILGVDNIYPVPPIAPRKSNIPIASSPLSFLKIGCIRSITWGKSVILTGRAEANRIVLGQCDALTPKYWEDIQHPPDMASLYQLRENRLGA